MSPIVSDAATPQFDLPRSTEVHSNDVTCGIPRRVWDPIVTHFYAAPQLTRKERCR